MEAPQPRLRAWTVSEAAADLAATVDVPACAAQVSGDIAAEVWDDRDEPGFRAALDRSVSSNIAAIFDIMRGRLVLETARPQQALEFAEVSAQLDVPAAEIERAYRVGVASVWTQWLTLATAHAERTDVPLARLVAGPSMTIMGYVDHILSSVVSRYDVVRGELQQTRRQLRRLLILQLLDGTLSDVTPEVEQQLDYCLADTHLALLVQGGRAQSGDGIGELRAAADARRMLVLQHGPQSWIVWLGRPAGFGPVQLSRLRRVLREGSMTVAVGEPSTGLAGWRRTYRQALDTARVQRALGLDDHRCVWAANVRLEALMLSDEERARQFVREELGPLADQDAVAQRLRETLLAWLSTGSHVSAAATLGVHENTIRNRIRQAEELLRTPLIHRRTELQVALRLERVLQDAGPSTDRLGAHDPLVGPDGAPAG
ncbi:MAG TPA: helix-turn-helix domain-containing protein [Baekduia sp.]|nr:helix-turn-helix domain-containing protein [Baekduia sp.]